MHRTIKAAIFDMDGTLIDSMSAWRRLNSEFVLSRGIQPTEAERRTLYTMSGMAAVTYMNEHFRIDCDFDDLCRNAIQAMETVYAGGVPLKPGAKDYLRRLGERGIKRVLATATPAKQALIALNRIGLIPYLDYIYCNEIIGLDKSNPAFYDRLCSLIGEEKQDCVMFEDALYAMRGARAAGLGVVGIYDDTSAPDEPSIRDVCDRFILSFDELP